MINIELPDFETDQVLKEAAKLHCLEMSDSVTILMHPRVIVPCVFFSEKMDEGY